MNAATVQAFYSNLDTGDFRCAPEDVPPSYGPRQAAIVIAGAPYTGAHTRRAIRAAMTRAGAELVTVNGTEWNRHGLAYIHALGA